MGQRRPTIMNLHAFGSSLKSQPCHQVRAIDRLILEQLSHLQPPDCDGMSDLADYSRPVVGGSRRSIACRACLRFSRTFNSIYFVQCKESTHVLDKQAYSNPWKVPTSLHSFLAFGIPTRLSCSPVSLCLLVFTSDGTDLYFVYALS